MFSTIRKKLYEYLIKFIVFLQTYNENNIHINYCGREFQFFTFLLLGAYSHQEKVNVPIRKSAMFRLKF